MTNIFRKTYGTRARSDNYFHKKREVSVFSTLCLPETKKTLDNQTIIKRFAYPEPVLYPENKVYPKEAK